MAISAEDMSKTYPLPTFRYRVNVRGTDGEEEFCCSTVSGLELNIEYATYKDGCGNWYQIPAQRQEVNISLKRGIFRGDSRFYEWINTHVYNSVEARDITISLTDESGETPYVTWSVPDAKPTKLTAPSFDGSSNEVAFEEIALKATRFTVAYSNS